MKRFKKIMIRAQALILFLMLLNSCQAIDQKQFAHYLEKANSYKAEIKRDPWGVPHIYGRTDADAAFGLAYAHAEDDFKNIAENQRQNRVAIEMPHPEMFQNKVRADEI